jgi:hypothetical protein
MVISLPANALKTAVVTNSEIIPHQDAFTDALLATSLIILPGTVFLSALLAYSQRLSIKHALDSAQQASSLTIRLDTA